MKNQNILIEKYPKFFEYLKDLKGPIMPIVFGFECGNGWYWLLSNLMETIYSYCENNEKEIPNITQIKEKYGGLRFYYEGGDDKIDGMVWLAEHLSYEICETCGTTENVHQTEGWIYTICDNCKKEKKKFSYIHHLKWKLYKHRLWLIKNTGFYKTLSVKSTKLKTKWRQKLSHFGNLTSNLNPFLHLKKYYSKKF